MRYTKGYDSVAELVEAATAARQRDPEDGCFHSPDWVGRSFATWEDVVAAANGTWDEGVRQVESMVEELRGIELPAPVSRRRRAVWADEGDEFNHDRFRSGQECWRAMRRQTYRAPQHVTIIAQVGGVATVPAAAFLWRGAAAIALADLLEQAGYRVTVYAANRAEKVGGRHERLRWVRIKDGADPVNLAGMVSAMAPWFYRSVFFQEHASQRGIGRVGQRVGGTRPLTDADVAAIEPGAILIQDVRDRRSAVAKVREVIEALSQ